MLAAAGGPAPRRDEALAALCRDYWRPVHAYIRRREDDPERAKDLTQEFFARLLERDWLAGLTREGGGFRGFLLTTVKRFLVDQHRRSTAAKRGGGMELLPLDDVGWEEPVSDTLSPEEAFDRRWALTVLDRAAARVRREAEAAGKSPLCEALAPFLSAEPEPGTYDALAPQLGLSASAIAMAVRRLRLRYRDHIRNEVAETLTDPARAEDELKELLAALRR